MEKTFKQSGMLLAVEKCGFESKHVALDQSVDRKGTTFVFMQSRGNPTESNKKNERLGGGVGGWHRRIKGVNE